MLPMHPGLFFSKVPSVFKKMVVVMWRYSLEILLQGSNASGR